MLIRRFFAFVISAFLIFFPAYSYATTSVGGWSALDTVTAGATNTINAAKTAGGKALNSSVTVAASASKVGKHLIKGGGAAAVAFAMVELADGAIDWVLDPANNRIKYGGDAAGGTSGYGFQCNRSGFNSAQNFIAQCNKAYGANSCSYDAGKKAVTHPLYGRYADQCRAATPEELLNHTKPNEKYIPIDTVAAKVIANAEAGHAPSQEAVKATALEGFAAGEHDAALDAAATEAGTENPPDTENPPKDGEAAPFDPSSIIAAINSLKAMLAGILSSMTGFFDWAQAPVPPDDQEKKDVPFATTGDVGLDEVDRFEQRIDFAGQCPVNDFSFSMMGVTYAKPIPYHHLCGFLEQIAPWLLAMCYLGTAYFVVENI